MKRVSVCCLSILLCGLLSGFSSGCNRAASPPRLPDTATFGWRLKDITETVSGTAPESVRSIGFVKSWRAQYAGPGVANVDVYRTRSQAAGLEMTQTWRATADTVTIFNPDFFVVIHWKSTDRAAATALVSQIERSLAHSD